MSFVILLTKQNKRSKNHTIDLCTSCFRYEEVAQKHVKVQSKCRKKALITEIQFPNKCHQVLG